MRAYVLGAWILILAIGCGPTPGSGLRGQDRAVDHEEPAPSAELPASEAFEIRSGETIELGGDPVWFSGGTPPGETVVVSLSIGRQPRRSVDVFGGGCAELDGFVYVVESVSDDEEPVARMRRAPVAAAPVVSAWGREERLEVQRSMRVDDLTLRAGAIYPYSDGGYGVVLNVVVGAGRPRELQMSGDREPTEHPLGDGRTMRLSVSGERDALGCPLLSLALIDPDHEVVTARAGEPVRIRRDATIVVGELRVRYRGWAEAMLINGSEQYAQLEVLRGDAVEHPSCRIGASIQVAGYTIEAISADLEYATLRIRPSP